MAAPVQNFPDIETRTRSFIERLIRNNINVTHLEFSLTGGCGAIARVTLDGTRYILKAISQRLDFHMDPFTNEFLVGSRLWDSPEISAPLEDLIALPLTIVVPTSTMGNILLTYNATKPLTPVLVYKEAPGESVAKVAKKVTAMALVKLFKDMLDVNRSCGFVHNDLHTGNIFYDDQQQKLTLIDLGRSFVEGIDDMVYNQTCSDAQGFFTEVQRTKMVTAITAESINLQHTTDRATRNYLAFSVNPFLSDRGNAFTNTLKNLYACNAELKLIPGVDWQHTPTEWGVLCNGPANKCLVLNDIAGLSLNMWIRNYGPIDLPWFKYDPASNGTTRVETFQNIFSMYNAKVKELSNQLDKNKQLCMLPGILWVSLYLRAVLEAISENWVNNNPHFVGEYVVQMSFTNFIRNISVDKANCQVNTVPYRPVYFKGDLRSQIDQLQISIENDRSLTCKTDYLCPPHTQYKIRMLYGHCQINPDIMVFVSQRINKAIRDFSPNFLKDVKKTYDEIHDEIQRSIPVPMNTSGGNSKKVKMTKKGGGMNIEDFGTPPYESMGETTLVDLIAEAKVAKEAVSTMSGGGSKKCSVAKERRCRTNHFSKNYTKKELLVFAKGINVKIKGTAKKEDIVKEIVKKQMK